MVSLSFTGYLRPPRGRRRQSSCVARHSCDRFGDIPQWSTFDHGSAMSCDIRSCCAGAGLGESHQRSRGFFWEEPSHCACLIAVPYHITRGGHLQYQNPHHGERHADPGLLFVLTGIAQDDEYRERAAKLLTANAPRIIELLSMYLQAPGMLRLVWHAQLSLTRCVC